MKWPTAELGELCTKIGSGATPRGGNKSYKMNGISLVRSMNVHMGRFKPDDLAFIDDCQAAKLNNVILEAHDVLLNITGASVARACTLDNSVLPARVNQHVCILRPDRDKLNYQYLMRFLTSETAQRRLLVIAGAGATREAITKTEIRKFQIPLPSLTEQKRIAGILDAADALRAKRREALAQLDSLLQSTFLDMFGDPIRNTKELPVLKSGKLFMSSPRLGTTKPVSGGGYLVVRVGELGGSTIDFEKCGRLELSVAEFDRFVLRAGDIVIARAIGSKKQLGKASFFDGHSEPVVIDSHVMRLRLNPAICDPRWFFSLITSVPGKQMLQQKGGPSAVQFNINTKQASDIDIPLPSIELQRRFATFVESVERQKARMRAHLAELDALSTSLQSRAFNGEL